ncbi:MAG: DUF2142 domain-containing protein [Actinomycetota bacterium]|nr:DUF2142 domain-containing protein [Actinomycetota bacterium]
MATRTRERKGRRRPHHGVRLFVVTWALVFAAMGCWSLATPRFAAPDEPVQVAKAAAVVRGQLDGRPSPGRQPAYGEVTIPAFFADSLNLPVCFHRAPTVPASCEGSAPASSAPTTVSIYVAHYPPLYYAVVGLPSLLGVGNWVLYLMRLTGAALDALFVALAVTAARRWSTSRLVLAGVLVSTTPMVLFLGGVVNPSSLEVAAAIATWTCGSLLVLEHAADPPPGLVAALAVSASVLELTRGISPFWLACTLVFLLAVGDRRHLVGLLRRRSVQGGLAAVAALGGLALAWTFTKHALDVISYTPLGPAPTSTILETSFAHNDFYLPGMVGVFGWFDTWAPTFTYVVWYGLVGLLGLAAAVVARLRQALALAALALAIVVVPVAISSSQVHRYGYTWSPRDTLPLAVGLPILAAALVGRSLLSAHRARLAGTVGTLAVLAQLAAFFEALRRYAVGTKGADLGFLVHADWRPPGGFWPVLAVEACALTGFAVLVRALVADGAVDRSGVRGAHRRGVPGLLASGPNASGPNASGPSASGPNASGPNGAAPAGTAPNVTAPGDDVPAASPAAAMSAPVRGWSLADWWATAGPRRGGEPGVAGE